MPQLYCQTTGGMFASVSEDPAAHLQALKDLLDLPVEMGRNDFYETITFAGVLQSEEIPQHPLSETPEPLLPWTLEDYDPEYSYGT